MLDGRHLADLLDIAGPVLYHGTNRAVVSTICAAGIVPGVEGGAPARCTYIADLTIARDWAYAHWGDDAALVAVDLRLLDPALLRPDPDSQWRPWLIVEDGLIAVRDDGQPARRTAEATHWITKESYWLEQEMTAGQMLAMLRERCSIAHRGPVPARACSLADIEASADSSRS